MLEHVLSSNVGDDCQGGPCMNDVRKILVWSDAKVYAARPNPAVQIVNDVKVRGLIGNEIVGVEISFGFRPLLNVPPQLLNRNRSVGRRMWLLGRPWYDARANNQCENHSNA